MYDLARAPSRPTWNRRRPGREPARHRSAGHRERHAQAFRLRDASSWTTWKCCRMTPGNMNIVGANEVAMALYYVDELAAGSVCQPRRSHRQGHRSGACPLHGESGNRPHVQSGRLHRVQRRDPQSDIGYFRSTSARRSSVPATRATWSTPAPSSFSGPIPASTPGLATFGTVRCAAREGHPVLQARHEDVHPCPSRRALPDAGIPARIEAKLPSACVVAMLVGVANPSASGRSPCFRFSHHSEPFMPGDRTCNGGAYTFQIPGTLAVADNVVIPMRVHDSASIRCIYAYLQQADHGRAERVPREGLPRRRRDVGVAGVHGHRAEAPRWLQEH